MPPPGVAAARYLAHEPLDCRVTPGVMERYDKLVCCRLRAIKGVISNDPDHDG